MPSVTYSSGGIRVSSSISASSSGSTTLYTCPSGCYAVVSGYVYSSGANNGSFGSTSGSAAIYTGSVPIASVSTPTPASQGVSTSDSKTFFSVYVGPGQSVTCSNSGTGVAYINGVQFTN